LDADHERDAPVADVLRAVHAPERDGLVRFDRNLREDVELRTSAMRARLGEKDMLG